LEKINKKKNKCYINVLGTFQFRKQYY
jgi:hypothetical protein